MAYKKLIKVRDVCQLLDKRKYPATQTVNGITFTNNGDGTITVNGTATQMAVYIVSYKMHPIIGHKYLITGNPNNSESDWYKVLFYVGTHMGEQHEKIFSVEKSDPISCYITVWNGITVSNLTFKPQLFDLTEMYGSGHEPTTVEQFRQDFPEEMYDYSPRCWATSYSRRLKVSNVCQLLDKSKYPATTTITGVAVSAKDNAFYVTGTCIQSGGRNNKLSETIVLRPGRYYFYTFNASEALPCLSKNIDNSIIIYGNSNMFTVEETTECYFGINFVKDIVYSGYLKPQLFDLTEMYGAGHEPTTVEQFRADFPNDLYDYKPYSIIPSYERNLTCKTKNLLPNYASSKTVNGVTFIVNSDGTITANGTSTDKFLFEFFKPTTPYIIDGRYTFSGCDSGSTSSYFLEFFGETTDGDITYRICINSPIVVNFINYKLISAYINVKSGATLENVIFKPMLELGDTATDYVPYGHL